MSTQLYKTTMILTTMLLMIPILMTMNHNTTKQKYTLHVKTAVKLACIINMMPLLQFINQGTDTTIIHIHWMKISNFSINLSFIYDLYSTTFTPIALFVTWSIMEFSSWYMKTDQNINQFFKYLLTFLITMMILTTANNLFQLLIGWEGVGIMSFMLIGWWSSRMNANSSAMQAIIYNRLGDIGLITTMAWLAMNHSTWELNQMFSQIETPSMIPLLGLILAATGKSAQFGLHPWLPAAMEGPTPVSALLHSSTMVVAGIFLLIRLSPLLEKNNTALTTCLCIGATTTVFTALSATTQNDIKKIIAFSTSSQLGLMMVTIGLNLPQLAFLHICTHAFFKALLFLCSGSIIHSLNNEQDLRLMGGIKKTMPITSTCLTIGTLALMGTPFLTGFYSKDTIIESMNMSTINAWALLMTTAATMMTAIYSLRLIFHTQMMNQRNPTLLPINENNSMLTKPLTQLTMGSILGGIMLSFMMLPTKPQVLTMPYESKLSALVVTVVGMFLCLATMDLSPKVNPKNKTPNSYLFSNQLGFFNLLHRNTPKKLLKLGTHTHIHDLSWLEKTGPQGTATILMPAIKKTTAQTGLIKQYLTVFIISTTIAITMT